MSKQSDFNICPMFEIYPLMRHPALSEDDVEACLEASHSKSSSCAKAYRFIVNSELCFWRRFSVDFLPNFNNTKFIQNDGARPAVPVAPHKIENQLQIIRSADQF